MRDQFHNNAMNPQNVLVPSVRDKDGTGYDIFSLLLKERIIVVAGQVETAMASTIIAQLKFLEHLDSTKPITMLVNSPGGSVIDGLAILDIMREVKCPITTVGNGMQASMGSILLAGGDVRKMTKNSMVLVHQIMGGAAGGTQHSDFEISGAFMALLHERLKNVYVEFIGLKHSFWDQVGERDCWLTAEQALKIGYINKIVTNEKPNGAYADYATRPDGEANSERANKLAQIEKMSKDEVIAKLNNGNANEAEWGRYRPELVVQLASFQEYWVPKKVEEFKQFQAVAAAANQNKPVLTEGTKKKQAAPKK